MTEDGGRRHRANFHTIIFRRSRTLCPWPCRCAFRERLRTGSGMTDGLKAVLRFRVRSEDRTASLAFRCEPERDAARWVAIVETSFAVDSASVVEYSVPDTGGLYPRADDDVSWHVRSTGLGLYVTGVPAEQFFRQVESDASDPREDLPVYLSVDGSEHRVRHRLAARAHCHLTISVVPGARFLAYRRPDGETQSTYGR